MNAAQIKPNAKHAGKLDGKIALIIGGSSGKALPRPRSLRTKAPTCL